MHHTTPPELGPMVARVVPRDGAPYKTAQASLSVLDKPPYPGGMSSNLPHERSGCFSGLLAGSRRQRGCQSVSPQEESASPLAPQESSHGNSLPGDFVGVIHILNFEYLWG